MNNETTTTATPNVDNTAVGKPTKLWLWCLATIQLLAVIIMSKVGVDDTTIKYSGFGILFLCSLMDIKAVKAAGYKVPSWWWGVAIFLPPVYLIVRVLKTDTDPAQRFVRFTPTLAWIVILVAMILLLSGCSADINATAEAILREGIPEHFEKNGMGGYLKVVDIKDVTMIKESGNTYKGIAKVTFKTIRGRSATKMVQYDLKGTFDGNQLLLEYQWDDSEDDNMEELFKKAGYSE